MTFVITIIRAIWVRQTAVDYQEVDLCESTFVREVFDKVTLVVCYQCQVSIIRIYNLMSVPKELKLF